MRLPQQLRSAESVSINRTTSGLWALYNAV
jgi:hypothetical protein